jgi:hypothetical protein
MMQVSARWLIKTLHESTLLHLLACLTGGAANPDVALAHIARIRAEKL